MFTFILQKALLVRVEAAVDIGVGVASEGEGINSRYKSPKQNQDSCSFITF